MTGMGEQTIRTKPEPYCPECGARMVLRTRRSDGERFWGCSNYPECKGTRQILSDGRPEGDGDELPMWDWGYGGQ